jgi:hypothetical protein
MQIAECKSVIDMSGEPDRRSQRPHQSRRGCMTFFRFWALFPPPAACGSSSDGDDGATTPPPPSQETPKPDPKRADDGSGLVCRSSQPDMLAPWGNCGGGSWVPTMVGVTAAPWSVVLKITKNLNANQHPGAKNNEHPKPRIKEPKWPENRSWCDGRYPRMPGHL